MADAYGGAKPKTRTPESSGKVEDLTPRNKSIQPASNGMLTDEKDKSFRYSPINGQVYNTEKYPRDIRDSAHKGAKPKKMMTTNLEMNSEPLRPFAYNGMSMSVRNEQYGTPDNKRSKGIGKFSKEKEQEYLTARERWKKSGLALRKYIAEKLGFKQDKNKASDDVNTMLGKEIRQSPKKLVDKKMKSKEERFPSVDMSRNGLELVNVRENDTSDVNNTCMSENGDFLKGSYNLERSRSEGSKEADALPRSRSFLRYLGLKKEKYNSPKSSQKGLKNSKSFEMSSSDAWPESSTDTCKSAASDWSADNTLTNHSAANSIWTNQKCQSTQTLLLPTQKCDKATKTENICEHRCKNRKHKHTKTSKSDKDSKKKSKQGRGRENFESAYGRGTHSQKKESGPKRWVGILDDEIQSSSEDEFEYVLDPHLDEVVRRVKKKRPNYSNEQQNAKGTDNVSDNGGEGSQRSSKEISDSTVEAMLGLHHALPYLPERFRNRLQSVQTLSDGQGQTTLHSSDSNFPRETTPTNRHDEKEKESSAVRSETGNALIDNVRKNKKEKKPLKKIALKDRGNWRKKTYKDNDKISENRDYMFDTIEDYERNLEVSLEDPFNVRSESNVDLCSGLMDLVREIDIPFIDEEGEARFNDVNKDRNSSSRDDSERFNGVISDSKTLSSNEFIDIGMDTNLDGVNETSFEDDPDYPGMKTLNDSFNRLLGDDDTDSTSESSILNDFLQRSRSDESRSRSKSSNDSLEADDEFECECEHCQLLRQHSYGTHNLDLMPPRLYLEDVGYPNDLDPSIDSSAAGHSDTDSNQGFRSAMFVDEYDFLLDRSSNELDWLIIDSRPLSVMLEDVIQQMLAVQPELLNEQAAPPAPQVVIENLQTIALTSAHIVQHPSCPICLCPSEMDEIMNLLPCQHLFHPICIQAWLVKSGTCPVCRATVTR